MKISTLLAIGLISLGSIGFVKFASSTAAALRNYNTVGTLRGLSNLRNEWTKGIIALSLERSVSQVLLTMDTPAPAEFLALNQSQRDLSAQHFTTFLQGVAEFKNFPNRDLMLTEADRVNKAIATLRATIDSQLALPLAKRSHSTIHSTINALKGAISKYEAQSDFLRVDNSITSSEAILLAKVQKAAWEIREFGGRARTLYAIAALHQTPLGPADRAAALGYLQRADDSWSTLRILLQANQFPDSVLAQIDEIKSLYNGAFLALVARMNDQMDMINAAAAASDGEMGRLDVVSFDRYFETSAVALDSAAKLTSVVSDELELYWNDREHAQLRIVMIDFAALFAMLVAVIVTIIAVNRKVTHRLRQGLVDLSELTNGALDRDIDTSSRDLMEMAQLSNGLQNLQQQLRRAAADRLEIIQTEAAQKQVVERLTDGLNCLAAGDLSQRIDEKFDPKYQGLADNFNAASAALGDLVARVVETSGTILSGARGINQATSDLSHRTETQGMTLQNAAAALEELTRNIIGSQGDAKDLDTLAGQATEKSAAMRVKMGQTVEAIEKIKTSSQQIEQIVGVIEDIAFQTNLLALNAGVEATRAGSEGSGFAVIASEVRGLAERSAQSAQDIKNLIAASGVEVGKGVEYVAAAENAVTDIGEQFAQISSLISRIANAATEQSQGLTKVNDGVSQLDLVTQTNVAMVEETTAECTSLTSVAQDLAQLVSRFQVKKQAFSSINDQSTARQFVA